jgi:4-hydroxybenzoate polyprenyltransferase
MTDEASPRISRGHRWLLIIPFVWQVAFVPLVNDIAWRPFSLPFPMVWQMVGIILTSIVIAIVFRLDERVDPEIDDDVPSERPLH